MRKLIASKDENCYNLRMIYGDYTYIWEHPNWKSFTWDKGNISGILQSVRLNQGRLLGRMESIGFEDIKKAHLEMLTEEIRKSSQIEDESLDKKAVRSSVAKKLGIDIGGLSASTKYIDGFVEVIIDATKNFNIELSEQRLCKWHNFLFSSQQTNLYEISVGKYRVSKSDPMQVISGRIGKQTVHFQAPPASCLNQEMNSFIKWFNDKDLPEDILIKAAVAHIWFLTLHPFEDGNGRIARAISEMFLAKSDKSQFRFYSMSSQIEKERNDYYDMLERTQKGNSNITDWIVWFLGCLERAILNADVILESVLKKSNFWKNLSGTSLNKRQILILNLLIDGLDGKLTTSKYAKLAKCSQDTAYRDIIDLMDLKILKKGSKKGRSTDYLLEIG